MKGLIKMKDFAKVKILLNQLRAQATNDFELHRIEVLEKDLFNPPKIEIIDETHQKFNGVMFYQSGRGHFFANLFLHRAVYAYCKEEIIEGYHIHHIDENKANNAVENLQMLTNSEHHKKHDPTGNLKLKKFTCKVCGKEYESFSTGRNCFCSYECRRKDFDSRHTTIKRNCKLCGKEFITRLKTQIYCSRKCADISRKKKVLKKCPYCGEFFEGTERGKFCSRKCAYEFRSQKHREKRICPICGKEFETTTKGKYKTCSQKCGVILSGLNRKKNLAARKFRTE